MSLLSYFFGSKQKTASVAKERLSLIIAHERNSQAGKQEYAHGVLQKNAMMP